MLALAFDEKLGKPEDRANLITEQIKKLKPAIALSRESDDSDAREYEFIPESIRADAVIACAPALRNTALFQSQNRETARYVFNRLRALGTTILDSPDLKPRSIRRRGDAELMKDVDKEIASVASLAVLWWGMAHGNRSARNYALPLSSSEYNALQSKAKSRFPADIIVRKSGASRKHFVHTTQFSSPEHEHALSREHPGLVTISVEGLTGQRDVHNTRHLLELIEEDRILTMGEVYNRASTRFEDAKTHRERAREIRKNDLAE